jgi:Kef-type K+ transport system membrane component KefB
MSGTGAYFVLMLGIMAVTGVLAQTINMPGIVGAFLAGLAVNADGSRRAGKNEVSKTLSRNYE